MKTFKILMLAIVGLGIQVAQAEPEFLDVITKKYNISDSSLLGQKTCGICHVSDSDYRFNPYGKQVANYLTDHNLKAVDDAVLEGVASEDADTDGAKNGDELKAGTDPAVANAPGGAATTAPAPPPEAPQPKPLVPKNGFHPAIVHFPIALLIAGLLFDLVGTLRKQRTLLYAGWYNTMLSAFSSLGAVASGFLAITMLKVPYKGVILNHMLLALSVAFITWIMVALRIHQHEKMTAPSRIAYYVLAAAAFILISWTGHLGGAFVYGE